MSILRSLNTGAAGLRSHSDAIGVVGDNIANVNTVGFKRSRGTFEDMLGRSVAGAGALGGPGAGSKLAHIEQIWNQGAMLTTDVPLDLAISGNGFFAVSGSSNGIDGRFYTRVGAFHVDESGFVVNGNGLRLQGYGVEPDGSLSSAIGDLSIDRGTMPASATTRVDLSANLSSDATVPPAWDPLDPSGTSNFSSTVTVYDSLGQSHDVTVYYRKSGANAWEWHAMVDGGELTGGTPGTPTEAANGTLAFTTSGELDNETTVASSWNFVGAAAGQNIAFDFGDSITGDGGTGLGGSTQFALASSTNALAQDGYAAGSVSGVTVGSDGTVTGILSNGQRRTIGQVVLASFGDVSGLERAGDGLWVGTAESGDALMGAAGAGGRGAIVSGALEQSNVDLAREFVDLIALQRGFQANSKIIQTADEMYGELVNIKR